jgi:adenylosuccinate synthase
VIHSLPATPNDLAACEPIYEEVDGWMTDTSNINSYDELPDAAKNYLKRLEEALETPIYMVSVSPQRGKTIQIQDILETPTQYEGRYPNMMR